VNDANKAKKQSVDELAEAHNRTAALEASADEHKRVEKALQKSEEKYRAILENIEDGYYEVDIAGNLVFFNDALRRIYGYTEDELMGMNNRQYMDEETAKAAYQTFNAVYRTGKPAKVFDWEFIKKDGTRVSVEASVSLIRDSTGKPVGFRGIVRDITERKQAEQAKKRYLLQREIIKVQKRALQELATPIIPVLDQIIVMPLIGSIDTLRAKDVMRALLAGIREHRAKIVILDITGVAIVDSGVANHLNKTIQAARLKGAHAIVTGISDAVAETIVDLGIDWSGIETLSDLQTGLRVALASMGLRIG
jgi:PAS domain S-box-containing protein